MNSTARLAILILVIGFSHCGLAQGLRGSGEILHAYTPAELPALERLQAQIRNGSYDPDLVQQAAETKIVKRALIELTTEILKHFPPSEYDYVSLGRSPSAISIALKQILQLRASMAEVIELPLSGLRHGHFEASWYRETLKKHFAKYFYPGASPSGRKVLVLDFVQKGGTIGNFANILEFGKSEGWIRREVHVLGLLNPAVDPRTLWLDTYNATNGKFPQAQWHSQVLPAVLWPYFYYSSFKHLAQYDGWELRSPEFEEAVKWANSGRGGSPRWDRSQPAPEPIAEPRTSSPQSNERKSIPSVLKFWQAAPSERSAYADQLRALIRADQVFAAAIKSCRRVHRAD